MVSANRRPLNRSDRSSLESRAGCFHTFDTLHRGMVLICHLVLPAAEAASAEDSQGLQFRVDRSQDFVASDERRRFHLMLSTGPGLAGLLHCGATGDDVTRLEGNPSLLVMARLAEALSVPLTKLLSE
jgi:hypothetical protein